MRSTAAIPAGARGLLFVTAAIWLALELRQSATQRHEAVVDDRSSRPVLRLATAVGVVLAIVLARFARFAAICPVAVAAWIGLDILWCGIGLRLWSFRTLGRYFTFKVQTSADQPVVTDAHTA